MLKTALLKRLALLAIVILTLACGTSVVNSSEATVADAAQLIFTGVDDTSDLPTWAGKELPLRVWAGYGTGGGKFSNADKDVYWPEVKRVTGAFFDPNTYFDNTKGKDFKGTLALVSATRDWPQVLIGGETPQLVELAKAGKLWDVAPYIKRYCPNIMSKIPQTGVFQSWWGDRQTVLDQPGKIFGLPYGMQGKWLPSADPTLDKPAFSIFNMPIDGYPYVLVRDDILRKIYPEAKTQAEIEALFLKQGKFTEADLFDVPINDRKQLFDFLYKIKKLNLKDADGRTIFPFFTHSNPDDNFALLGFSPINGYATGNSWSGSNYWLYWDVKAKTLKYMFKEAWFKELLRGYNKLVRDGVSAKEALIDSTPIFQQKLNQGLYAVIPSWDTPSSDAMKDKPYRYRKVWLRNPIDTSKFVFYGGEPKTGCGQAYFFKDTLTEAQLIQALKYFDYIVSDAGQKLVVWGPRSAGLWTVENGQRIFKNKELEEDMVYQANNGAANHYNLLNGSYDQAGSFVGVQTYIAFGRNKYAPGVTYTNKRRNAGDADKYFVTGLVKELPTIQSAQPNLWSFTAIPEVDRYWKARPAFEKALTKVYTATDNSQFAQFYKDMVTLAEKNGLSKATLVQINDYYAKTMNPGK